MKTLKKNLIQIADTLRHFFIKENILNSVILIDNEANIIYVNILIDNYTEKFEPFKEFINSTYEIFGINHKKINNKDNLQKIDCSLKHNCLIYTTWTNDKIIYESFQNQFNIETEMSSPLPIQIFNIKPSLIFKNENKGIIVDILEGYFEFIDKDNQANVIFTFGDTESIRCIINNNILKLNNIQPKEYFLLIIRNINEEYVISFELMSKRNITHTLINEKYKHAFTTIGLKIN